jgi:hypothetical protein
MKQQRFRQERELFCPVIRRSTLMSKKAESEMTTAVPVANESAVALASVEAECRQLGEHHLDQLRTIKPTSKTKGAGGRRRSSRRSRRARSLVHRRDRKHALVIGRRSSTQSSVQATKHAPDLQADGGISRQSLTAEFFTCNEKSVESTIQKGHVIQQGRDKLPHGQFAPWLVEDLRLGERKTALWKADIHMQIAGHPVLSNPKYRKDLPSGYRTLWVLAKIRPPERLVELLSDGVVHHDISREEAEDLRRITSDKPPKSVLPLPTLPEALAVLLDVVLYFQGRKGVSAHLRKRNRPSEPRSEHDIDDAVQWIKARSAKMKGEQ